MFDLDHHEGHHIMCPRCSRRIVRREFVNVAEIQTLFCALIDIVVDSNGDPLLGVCVCVCVLHDNDGGVEKDREG